MSRVKQWPVVIHPYGQSYARDQRRRALESSRQASAPVSSWAAPEVSSAGRPSVESPSAPEAAAKSHRLESIRGVRSTGIFEVPSDTVIQLIVAISSFDDEEQTAAVRIRRVTDGGLQPVYYRVLRIAPGGAERIVVDGLGGETVEVEVTLPSDQLVPTAAVTQFFPADAGILVLVYKAPGDFIPV